MTYLQTSGVPVSYNGDKIPEGLETLLVERQRRVEFGVLCAWCDSYAPLDDDGYCSQYCRDLAVAELPTGLEWD